MPTTFTVDLTDRWTEIHGRIRDCISMARVSIPGMMIPISITYDETDHMLRDCYIATDDIAVYNHLVMILNEVIPPDCWYAEPHHERCDETPRTINSNYRTIW